MVASAAPCPGRERDGARAGLGRDGATGRARDQEPAHADQAVGAASAARLSRPAGRSSSECSRNAVEQILTEIDRLTEIARAFSRYGAPLEAGAALEPVEVHGAVREALTLYRAADESIRYVDELAPDLPAVIARPGELKEVLLNLVENAREALGGAGTVTVRGEAVDGRVELAVEDDGPGIPPDLLARVFDPHFSTRSTGTGLGLAIVRRLVESWGEPSVRRVSRDAEPPCGSASRRTVSEPDNYRSWAPHPASSVRPAKRCVPVAALPQFDPCPRQSRSTGH
jgi:signal transduction histidine kinase